METLGIIVGVILVVLVLIGSSSKEFQKKQKKAKRTTGGSTKSQAELDQEPMPEPETPQPEWPDMKAAMNSKEARVAALKRLEEIETWAEEYNRILPYADTKTAEGRKIEKQSGKLDILLEKARDAIDELEEISDFYQYIPGDVMDLTPTQLQLCWHLISPSDIKAAAKKLGVDDFKFDGYMDGDIWDPEEETGPEPVPSWLEHVPAAKKLLKGKSTADKRRAKLVELAGEDDAAILIDLYLQHAIPEINVTVRDSLQEYDILGPQDLTEQTDWDAILNLPGVGKKTLKTLKGYVATPEPA